MSTEEVEPRELWEDTNAVWPPRAEAVTSLLAEANVGEKHQDHGWQALSTKQRTSQKELQVSYKNDAGGYSEVPFSPKESQEGSHNEQMAQKVSLEGDKEPQEYVASSNSAEYVLCGEKATTN